MKIKLLILVLLISSSIRASQLDCDRIKPTLLEPNDTQAVIHVAVSVGLENFTDCQADKKSLISEEKFISGNIAELEAALTSPNTRTHVIRNDTQILGFVMASRLGLPTCQPVRLWSYDGKESLGTISRDHFAKIDKIAVIREAQGNHLGKKLMRKALEDIASVWPDITHVDIELYIRSNDDCKPINYIIDSLNFRPLRVGLQTKSGIIRYSKKIEKSIF